MSDEHAEWVFLVRFTVNFGDWCTYTDTLIVMKIKTRVYNLQISGDLKVQLAQLVH